jgi:undecaprenyl-diphosphatase
MSDYLLAALLGFVEGLTEFIPVSSTGHLLLLSSLLDFEQRNSFVVPIQLGAILALVGVYFGRLLGVATRLPSDPGARRFALGVVLAFLPAAAVGVLFHDFITRVLFDSPALICTNLIVGGAVLLALDRFQSAGRHTDAMQLPLRTSVAIGLFQCLALVPGVSRSGATVAGALLLGCDKRTAAEFSFFLAMPTMAGAFTYDLLANRDELSFDDAGLIAAGFAAAFVAALLVVKTLLAFVSKHGFAPFAWWRIAVGAAGLTAISLGAL